MEYIYRPKQLNWIKEIDFFIEQEKVDINLYEDGVKIDLSKFKNIKMLGCDLKVVYNFEKLPLLSNLGISGYKDRLNYIEKQHDLEFLTIAQSQISKLESLVNLKSLVYINLFINPKLTDISGIINHPSLKELEIESCKNIPVSHLVEVVISLKKLEVLKLHNFEFEDIAWVKQLPNLKDLVITRSNVIDGDISPAAHLEYVAIDNRKHYNYRFDSTTRTIHPVRPKGVYVPKYQNEGSDKHKRSVVQIPHFGDFDAKSLDMDYETDMAFKDVRVNLELHFEEESIAKSKLNGVIKLLQSIEKDHDVIKDMLKNDFIQSGVVKEYFEYFIEEIEDVTEVDFWKSLVLKRIAFYPHDEDDYGVYDFGIDEISPYVLSLKVDHKGKFTGLEMES
jgi:hypothetical protein